MATGKTVSIPAGAPSPSTGPSYDEVQKKLRTHLAEILCDDSILKRPWAEVKDRTLSQLGADSLDILDLDCELGTAWENHLAERSFPEGVHDWTIGRLVSWIVSCPTSERPPS